MKSIVLPNSQDLPNGLDAIPDGRYWVVETVANHRVSITKPGIKPNFPRDIAVSIHYPDGSVKQPSHYFLLQDFLAKCIVSPDARKALFNAASGVVAGQEPAPKSLASFEGLWKGMPAGILLHALKWVWVEEDRNYPPPGFLGKRMSWAKYILIGNGLTAADVGTPQGQTLFGGHGYTEDDLQLIQNRSGSRHLR